MPPALVERIRQLSQQLLQALDLQDWEQLGRCDQQLRELLAELPPAADMPADTQRSYRQLQALHRRALQQCVTECQRLKARLEHHQQYSEGANAYQRIDSLPDEGTL